MANIIHLTGVLEKLHEFMYGLAGISRSDPTQIVICIGSLKGLRFVKHLNLPVTLKKRLVQRKGKNLQKYKMISFDNLYCFIQNIP